MFISNPAPVNIASGLPVDSVYSTVVKVLLNFRGENWIPQKYLPLVKVLLSSTSAVAVFFLKESSSCSMYEKDSPMRMLETRTSMKTSVPMMYQPTVLTSVMVFVSMKEETEGLY